MTELAPRLGSFLQEYLPRHKGASRHTMESYALCYRLLAVFAAERHGVRPCGLQIEHLDIPTVLGFLDHLETNRGNAARTRNVRLAAIKSFFHFLEFREPACLDLARRVRAIPQKKGDVPLIGYIDRKELQALLDAPDPHTVSGVRDRAMLHLAYNAGLRVSELVGLGTGDLKRPGLNEVHVMGKGRRERVLPLWKETRCVLRDWLGIRPHVADQHLFLNAQKTGITRRGFAKRLALHAENAALDVPSIAGRKVTPHVLRHSCAVHTLEATGDVRKVSLWLGHSSLQTTEMYLRMDPVEKLSTLSEWLPPTLRKGSFDGVHDQLLAMLNDVGTP